MATAPSPRRRKARFVRDAEPPDDLLLVIRAVPGQADDAIADIASDAQVSADTYVVLNSDGARFLLYGVSVFAHHAGDPPEVVLTRFRAAEHYLEVSVGALRSAGFAVLATGTNVDHFDVLLSTDTLEQSGPVPAAVVEDAARRLVNMAGPLRASPAYAGEATIASEEEP